MCVEFIEVKLEFDAGVEFLINMIFNVCDVILRREGKRMMTFKISKVYLVREAQPKSDSDWREET